MRRRLAALVLLLVAVATLVAGCGGDDRRNDTREQIDLLQRAALADLSSDVGSIDEAKPDSYGSALAKMADRADAVAVSVGALGKPPSQLRGDVDAYVHAWRDLATTLRSARAALTRGDATAAEAALARYRAFVPTMDAAIRAMNHA